mgnify:CR=1 FL=1
MNSKMGATIAIDVDTFTWESACGACVCARVCMAASTFTDAAGIQLRPIHTR